MSDRPAPEFCAVCGAAVPTNARACPECGADERTGWREPGEHDGLDLPDGNFDHARFAETELEQTAPRKGKALFWWLTTVTVLIGMVLLLLLSRFWGSP